MKRFFLLPLLISLLSAQDEKPTEANIFVSLDGDDSNPGIQSRPKKTIEGAMKALRDFREEGMITDEVSVNLWLRGGIYRPNQTITLTDFDSGTAKTPFRIRAYQDELVVFDCGKSLAQNLFKPTDDARIPAIAKGKVVSAKITNEDIKKILLEEGSQISFDDRMMTLARFPNHGFAIFGEILSSDTAKQEGSLTNPVGAKVRLSPSSKEDWQVHLPQSPRARLKGYMCSDWLKEDQEVVSTGSGNNLQLVNGSTYGISPGRRVGRVYLENILCELDSLGEWFFDSKSDELFLWPPTPLQEDGSINIWAGDTVFEVTNASFTTIENVTIQNLYHSENGTGAINIKGGHHNEIRGCTFRNIASPANAFNIKGKNNGARSSNIYDVNFSARLGGGKMTHDQIEHGENFIVNSHFTQIYAKSFYGKVAGIVGAGNIFRNNLCHNLNGQIVTLNGVDHLVEKNEIFNVGIEEGDGGSFYQGAMSWSWGNTFQHNFFHHIMCNPEMYSRAAIFSDDGDLGDNVIGNVFYKAGEGFKINGGAGHYAANNACIKGIHAFQVLDGDPKKSYDQMMDYLDTEPVKSDKANLLGRGFPTFGKEGWKEEISSENWPEMISSYWLDRYPRMRETFDLWYKKKSAERINLLENNRYYAFTGEPNAIPKTTKDKSGRSRSSVSGFENPKSLNFASRAHSDIPFAEIGLYKDAWRTSPPLKDDYRSQIESHWRDESSRAQGKYEPAKVNRRVYFNTGLLLDRLQKAQKPQRSPKK